MKPHRIALAITLSLSTVTLPGPTRAAFLSNGVAAGDVTANTAIVWGMPDAGGDFSFEIATDAGFASIVGGGTVNGAVAGMPVKLDAVGLNPGTTYYYRGIDGAGNSANGQFKTPYASGRNGLSFGVSGDWRGPLAPYPAVSNVAAKNLDVFVQLGDTIYAENYDANPVVTVSDLAGYRARYRETLSDNLGQTNQIRQLRQSTASLVSIDDHEVVNDFAGGAMPVSDNRFDNTGAFINETQRYQQAMQAFHEYMPIRQLTYGATGDARTADKLKLYRGQQYGQDAAMFLLDNRSFRDQELPGVSNPLDPIQVGGFLQASQFANRTMLGQQQLTDLKADLLQAQNDGVTWKFVMVAEPIQKLGVVGGADRFEGYAAERDALLKFIDVNGIDNVVFVSADIHGTVVNNLNYFDNATFQTRNVKAWEITTGAVAYADPFGPTVIDLANQAGLLSPADLATYQFLLANGMNAQLEGFIQGLVNNLLTLGNNALSVTPFGASYYDLLGLNGSNIPATLLQGAYTATHSYGWTEFNIDEATQALTVTTWGVPYYDATDLAADPNAIAALTPQVVSQFQVAAVPEPETWAMLLAGLGLVGAVARRRRAG
jgi:phosphodiesterase/alkaline phosphatase D-like protein